MKVLQVIDTLNVGGAERVLVDISNLLVSDNVEVTVLQLTHQGPLSNDLSPLVRKICLNRRFKFALDTARNFITILNQYDIIHMHMRHVLKYFWYCACLSPCRSAVVFHDHFGDIQIDSTVPLYMRFLKKKITYIGVSQQLCEWANKKVGFNKVHLLSNIIVPNSIRMKELQKSIITKRKKRILIVSNLKRAKNIEFALKLASALREDLDFTLDIYGRPLDELYYNNLVSAKDNYDLDDIVSFNTQTNSIRNILADYDLALHCAISETGPLVLIEYIAAKLPFISYNTGEVPKQLQPHLPDFIIHNFDIKLWKERIVRILTMPVNTYYEQFNLVFERYYSPSTYRNTLKTIYLNLVEDVTA